MSTPQKGFVPMPSLGHELGVMFGFFGLMAICMTAYGIAWQFGNKRSQRKEAERVEQLRNAGLLKEEKYAPGASGGATERREDL